MKKETCIIGLFTMIILVRFECCICWISKAPLIAAKIIPAVCFPVYLINFVFVHNTDNTMLHTRTTAHIQININLCTNFASDWTTMTYA